MATSWLLRLCWLVLAHGLDMEFGDPSQVGGYHDDDGDRITDEESRAGEDIDFRSGPHVDRREQQPDPRDMQAFDCNAGLSEWKIVWGYAKKRWCCDHKNRGCPAPPAPAPAPLASSSGLRSGSIAVAPPPLITDPGRPGSEEYDAYNKGMREGKVGEYVMKYLEKHPRQINGISKKVLDDVSHMLQEQFHDLHKQSGASATTVPAEEASEEPRHHVSGMLLVMVGAMVGLTCSAILCLGMACGVWWAQKLQAVPTQDPLFRTDGEPVTAPGGPQGEEQSMVALEEAE